MFTGIVQSVGRITQALTQGDGLRIAVALGGDAMADVKPGDSIAVAGCCLTVVSIDHPLLSFDVSAETLRCTTGLDRPARVNLEPALRLSDRLGGHLLTGHIDAVGAVVRVGPVGAGDGSRSLEVDAPEALTRYIATKGSIAVDGVSLTVNGIVGRRFATNLIPHTLAATTLADLTAGMRVNLEIDIVARYLERMVSYER